MSSESAIDVATRAEAPLKRLQRLAAGAAAAVLVTFALYWLMAELVAMGAEVIADKNAGRIVDFVRVKKEPELIRHEKPEKPDKPETPPETPQPDQQAEAPEPGALNISMNIDTDISLNRLGLSAEGEYLPIVKVAPLYPPRAQSRGIEGWVLLEFTVTETGAVIDPVVIEAEPQGVFDDAAKRAVVKFKYKPRVVGGRAVSVPKVQHLITFQIDR